MAKKKEVEEVKVSKVAKPKAKSTKEKTIVKPTVAPTKNFIHTFVDHDRPSYGITGKEGALESSEVYDEADIASALEAGLIAQALERHKEKVAPERHPDFDGEHCVDCGVEIPEVRLAMHKVRCVDCQTALEKKSKFYSR